MFYFFKVSIVFCAYINFSSNSFAQIYTLTGKIKGFDDGWVYIRHRERNEIDSAKVTNGLFTIKGRVFTPEFCAFGLSYKNVKDYFFGFFIEKGRFHISCEKDLLNDTAVYFSGGPTEKQFQQFQKKVAYINQKHFSAAQSAARLQQLTSRFTLTHPNSYVSSFAIFSYVSDHRILYRLYYSLSPAIRRSYYGNQIAKQLSAPLRHLVQIIK